MRVGGDSKADRRGQTTRRMLLTSDPPMRRHLSWAALVAASLAVWSTGAGATALVALDVAGLTDGSDAVVRGHVVRVESRWTRDKLRIVTDVEISVDGALKGEPPRTVVLLQPGGQVGDVGQVVSGLARFQAGEEVLVFLERQGPERYALVGMAQGKLRIERSTDGRAAYAVPEDVGDALLVDRRTGAPSRPLVRAQELGELERQIRDRVRAPQGRGGPGKDPKERP